MKEVIVVKADTNDGDYITEETVMTGEMQDLLNRVVPVIKACEEYHNWPNSEYEDTTVEELYKGKISEKDLDLFSELVPWGENGMHSITSIRILKISEDKELL